MPKPEPSCCPHSPEHETPLAQNCNPPKQIKATRPDVPPQCQNSRATKDKTETQPRRMRGSTNSPARKLGGEGSLNPRVSPAAVLKAETSTSRQIGREGKTLKAATNGAPSPKGTIPRFSRRPMLNCRMLQRARLSNVCNPCGAVQQEEKLIGVA